ncbi:MAG: hypothetical protein JKY60_10265, partial [Kordiimonadaceae bacterium]|nr:hypothetical protein [Kordiimonadaceae bacterium]
MIFKTSRFYFAKMLLLSLVLVAATAWLALTMKDLNSLERGVVFFGVAFFSIIGLIFLFKLFAGQQVIELTKVGFFHSDYPNQLVAWQEVENIELVLLGLYVSLKMKSKYHPVIFNQRASK